jgi:hypothetical protein
VKVRSPDRTVWRVRRRWVPWRRRLRGALDSAPDLGVGPLGDDPVIFGQHWTVEARRGWKPYWEAPSGDWQESGLRIHAVADAIRHGQLPPHTLPD